ncbi:MAG: hypothetical protein ABH914_02700 [Candidatus Omnitrophota bacterium]
MYRQIDNNSHWSLVIGHLFSVFCLLSSVLCLLSSVFCPLLSAEDKNSYDDNGRRDPFVALVTPDGRLLDLEPADSEKNIVLEGIIYDEDGRSYAIINGDVVGVGDYVLGHTVLKIEGNKVTILQDNEPTEYMLEKEEL